MELNDTIDWNKYILFRSCNELKGNVIASSVYVEWRNGLSEIQQAQLNTDVLQQFYTLFTGFWRNDFNYSLHKTSLVNINPVSRFDATDNPSRHIAYWYLRLKDDSKKGTLCIKIPMYIMIKNLYASIDIISKYTTIENPHEDLLYISRYMENYFHNFLLNYPPIPIISSSTS